MIGVFGSSCVSIPLFDIESKQSFIGVTFGLFMDVRKVLLKVDFEVLVEVFTKEVGYRLLARNMDRS